jgi:hypothetical protein
MFTSQICTYDRLDIAEMLERYCKHGSVLAKDVDPIIGLPEPPTPLVELSTRVGSLYTLSCMCLESLNKKDSRGHSVAGEVSSFEPGSFAGPGGSRLQVRGYA